MFGRKQKLPYPIMYPYAPPPVSFPPGNGYRNFQPSQPYYHYQHPGYHPYMEGGGTMNHQNMPFAPQGPMGIAMGQWQGGSHPYADTQNVAQMLFDNPLQPPQNPSPYGGFLPGGQQPLASLHPYPQNTFLPKQTGGFQSVMNSFKNQEGTLDVNKMLDTAGQMMNAVTQVSSMVKGLGGILKV
jgi:hypothetical protein